jgi:hypothetical protein
MLPKQPVAGEPAEEEKRKASENREVFDTQHKLSSSSTTTGRVQES